jgi:hypothetical protein
MKKLILLFASCAFLSCSGDIGYKNKKHSYIISKSDDNNWTTSAQVYADSFYFVAPNHIEFYLNGKKSNLRGEMIKVFSTDIY